MSWGQSAFSWCLYGLFCSTDPYSPPPDSISCYIDSTYLLYIPLSPNLIYANLGVQYNLQFLSVLTHISMWSSGLEPRWLCHWLIGDEKYHCSELRGDELVSDVQARLGLTRAWWNPSPSLRPWKAQALGIGHSFVHVICCDSASCKITISGSKNGISCFFTIVKWKFH